MSKRGLSDVVSVVLIIMLVVAAVAAMWIFISPIVKNIALNKEVCYNAPVEILSCQKSNITVFYGTNPGYNVAYKYSLSDSGRIKGVNSTSVILQMDDGETIAADGTSVDNNQESGSAVFVSNKDAEKAIVLSTFILDDGTKQTCEIPAKQCNDLIRGNTKIEVVSDGKGGYRRSGSGGGSIGVGDNAKIDTPVVLSTPENLNVISGNVVGFLFSDEEHSVTPTKISDTQAQLVIQSEPQTFTLSLGESRLVSLGNDFISVKLNSISGNSINFTLTPSSSITRTAITSMPATISESNKVYSIAGMICPVSRAVPCVSINADNVVIEVNGYVSCFGNSNIPCVSVNADNVVIDGKGNDLYGVSASNGIDIFGRKNVVVKNLIATNFLNGINVSSSSNIGLSSVSVPSNQIYGIYLNNVSDSYLKNIPSIESHEGIYLSNSSNNVLYNITHYSLNRYTVRGILIDSKSSNNNISYVNITATSGGVGIVVNGSRNNLSYVTSNSNEQSIGIGGNGIEIGGGNNIFSNINVSRNWNYGIRITSGVSNSFNGVAKDNYAGDIYCQSTNGNAGDGFSYNSASANCRWLS